MAWKINPFTGKPDYYEVGGAGTPAATVTDETAFGVSKAVGVSTNYAREDHTHGSPTNPVTGHEAAGDPHTGYQKESEKGQVNGYASLDGSGKVPDGEIPSGIARDSEVSGAVSAHEGSFNHAEDFDDLADGTVNKAYTATEKTKLAGIAAGAEVNVNADWNAGSGDAQILNKPATYAPSSHDNAAHSTQMATDAELDAHVGLTTSAHGGLLPSSAFVGLAKITVGTSAPGSPGVGDLWVDTN